MAGAFRRFPLAFFRFFLRFQPRLLQVPRLCPELRGKATWAFLQKFDVEDLGYYDASKKTNKHRWSFFSPKTTPTTTTQIQCIWGQFDHAGASSAWGATRRGALEVSWISFLRWCFLNVFCFLNVLCIFQLPFYCLFTVLLMIQNKQPISSIRRRPLWSQGWRWATRASRGPYHRMMGEQSSLASRWLFGRSRFSR